MTVQLAPGCFSLIKLEQVDASEKDKASQATESKKAEAQMRPVDDYERHKVV